VTQRLPRELTAQFFVRDFLLTVAALRNRRNGLGRYVVERQHKHASVVLSPPSHERAGHFGVEVPRG
jgi:hypothetical protein